MTRYFKATRPDGSDFRTGTVVYQVGERTVHPWSTRRTRNNPSTYLSVSTVATECTGMRWPCRLFAVEGVGKPMRADDLPHKRCFLAVDVVEELPAHLALGPQGEQVAALIERCGSLTADEIERLAASSRAAAWAAARRAAGDASRGAAWDATWAAARDAAWAASSRAAARGAAWDATWDASWSLLVRDLIPADQFDLLYGPWASAIGDTR